MLGNGNGTQTQTDADTISLTEIKQFLDINIGKYANVLVHETMRGRIKSVAAGKVNLGVDDNMLFTIDVNQVVAYSLSHLPISGGQVAGSVHVFEDFWHNNHNEEAKIVVNKHYRTCKIYRRSEKYAFLGVSPGISITVPYDRIKGVELVQ